MLKGDTLSCMMILCLLSYFTITIEDDKYTAAQKEKMFIADIDKAGRKVIMLPPLKECLYS
jgi:hypothetical protein